MVFFSLSQHFGLGTIVVVVVVVILLVEFMNVYFFIMGICFNIFLLHSSVIR